MLCVGVFCWIGLSRLCLGVLFGVCMCLNCSRCVMFCFVLLGWCRRLSFEFCVLICVYVFELCWVCV